MKAKLMGFLKQQKVLLVLLAAILGTALASPVFFTYQNLSNFLLQITPYGIVAIGVTFVIISGEFDLSVGSVLALGGVLSVYLTDRVGYGVAIISLFAGGVLIGLLYALLILKVGMTSFVVTLAGQMFYRGLAYLICDSRPISCKTEIFSWLGSTTIAGIYLISYIFIALILVAHFVLRYTTLGRNICAVGGNAEVAAQSGIRVNKYKFITLSICSTMAMIAGMMLASRLNRAAPTAGEDAYMFALSAVIIGGTSMSGGEGSGLSTLIGIFLMGIISNALNILGVMSYYQLAIRGLLLIVVICFDRYKKNHEMI